MRKVTLTKQTSEGVNKMKAVEKAYYNLQFAVVYGEELKPISTVTKKKVEAKIREEFENNKNKLKHSFGFDEEDYERETKTLVKMLELLK